MPAEFLNLCPHDVVLYLDSGRLLTFPRSTVEARVTDSGIMRSSVALEVPVGDEIFSIPSRAYRLPIVTGLPDPVEGRMLIVSRIVQDARPRRVDLVSPSQIVLGQGGVIKGCRALRTQPLCPP